MHVARALYIVPVIALLPACGTSLRIGPQAGVYRGDPAMQVAVTAAAGIADAESHSPPKMTLTFPVSFRAGSRLNDGQAVSSIDFGIEGLQVIPGTRFGYRVGGNAGAWLSSSGALVGVRGGPVLALTEWAADTEVPTLSLEAFGSIGVGDEMSGHGMYGAALTLGLDYFGTFNLRMPAGRPLRDEASAPVAAGVRRGGSWGDAPTIDMRDLDLGARTRIGEAWLEDARMEHASIATFSRLALELMAVGAPYDLVSAAHRAALDEARHAKLCFGIAAAYLDRAIEPSELALGDARGASTTVNALATASLVDGCLGEGVAASIAAARARRAKRPVVQKALRAIARDEARHAELGWKVLAWCLREGGESTRSDIERTWATFRRPLLPIHDGAMVENDHGEIAGDVALRALVRTEKRVGARLRTLLAERAMN